MNENTTVSVLVDTINKVKAFVEIIGRETHEAELKSGSYIVDAKSIMGVFSLDVTKPVKLVIHGTDKETEETVEALKNSGFIVQ